MRGDPGEGDEANPSSSAPSEHEPGGFGRVGQPTTGIDRGVWSAEAAREHSTPHVPAARVQARRRRPGLRLAMVLLSGLAVVVLFRFASPAISDWIQGTPDTTAPVAAPDPCEIAFRTAIAAGTRTARIATLQACNADQWIAQQTETPLSGETLRSLCDARFGLRTDACADADAEREAEAGRTTTHPEPATRDSGNTRRYDSGATNGSPAPGSVTPPVSPQQGGSSYASPTQPRSQPHTTQSGRPASPDPPGPSFDGTPYGADPPGPSF